MPDITLCLAAIPAEIPLWSRIWFAILCLSSLLWLKRHYDLYKGRSEPILDEAEPGPPDEALPALSMLIAAKDEESNVARCLRGLLRQEYPRLQVIVINDRSSDKTGAIIDEFSRSDPRLTALHVTALPPGWFGKNHAMHVGVGQATGAYLCFSDADCTFNSPQLLRAALRFALRERVDFLSVLPRLEASTFWECVVQPVASAILLFWFPPARVNNPRSRAAYANGAFMLMSRAAYDRLGGHEPVKATLNEDMHLARRAKALGVSLRVIRGGDLFQVRMYTGLSQIWRGWTRIFYGCFGSLGGLLGSVALLSIMSLGPYISLAASPWLPGGAWIAAAATAAILAQQSILFPFYSLAGLTPWWALTYPIGAGISLAMTLNAMRRLGGAGTNWRGTQYQGGAHPT